MADVSCISWQPLWAAQQEAERTAVVALGPAPEPLVPSSTDHQPALCCAAWQVTAQESAAERAEAIKAQSKLEGELASQNAKVSELLRFSGPLHSPCLLRAMPSP